MIIGCVDMSVPGAVPDWSSFETSADITELLQQPKDMLRVPTLMRTTIARRSRRASDTATILDKDEDVSESDDTPAETLVAVLPKTQSEAAFQKWRAGMYEQIAEQYSK